MPLLASDDGPVSRASLALLSLLREVAKTLLLLRLLSYSGCFQVLGDPVLRPVSLLLSPTVIGRRARTLPHQARSAPYLSRSLLLIVDQGWGAVYGYIGHFLGALWGISGWVRGALQTHTISG